MAEIFLARETGLAGFRRPVVVKRILPELGQDKAFVELFLDEARLAARLIHPKIVQIYDLGFEQGTYFIAMEFVPGCDLGTLLEADPSPVPVAEALWITADVLEGLHYAHTLATDRGRPLEIVHRDIAPRNVLLSLDGSVKIADFGIAKARIKVSVTLPGMVVGTFGFMAPEQARGEAVDRRSDLFSVGALLYRMVVGRDPYQGAGLRLVDRVRAGEYAPPRAVAPEIEPEIERVILRAMSAAPAERYPTAGDMKRAVLAAARAAGVSRDAEALTLLLRQRMPLLARAIAPFVAGEGDGEDEPDEDTVDELLPPPADDPASPACGEAGPSPAPGDVDPIAQVPTLVFDREVRLQIPPTLVQAEGSLLAESAAGLDLVSTVGVSAPPEEESAHAGEDTVTQGLPPERGDDLAGTTPDDEQIHRAVTRPARPRGGPER
jgi:serine/threonine protein kinase